MKIRGERILLLGDEYSRHGTGQWLVDAGSNRSSSAPGDLLGSMLAEQGAAAVQLDANPGRSAVSLWQEPSVDKRIANDLAFAPTQVIVFLGLNDLGLDTGVDVQGFKAIKSTFPDAEIWAVGPPNFADPALNTHAAIVYQTLASVFGAGHVIDLRPFTMDSARTTNGVGFTATSAPEVARTIATMLEAKSPLSAGKMVLWGLGIGALVAAGVWILRREKRTLDGLNSVLDAAGDEEIVIEDPNVIDAEFVEKPAEGLGQPLALAAGSIPDADESIQLEATKRERKPKGKITVFDAYEIDLDNRGQLTPAAKIDTSTPGDYGADPIGDGTFRMVPSGDIVDFEERNRRLDEHKKKSMRGVALAVPKETPIAMIRFASRDARSRFIDAYRKRLIESGYEPHHAQDLVHAQLFEPGLTAYISGTDDIDRVRDVASEVRGVMVKNRPDLDEKPQLDGAEDETAEPP